MKTVFTTKRPSNLALCLKIRGSYRTIRFTPPVYFGIAYPSTFSTSDEDIIAAMKKHPDFNVTFFVKEEVDTTPKVVEAAKVKPLEEELRDPATAVYDDTVTTKRKAIAYVQGKFDDTFSSTTNIEDMKREAARRWNVIFTKLN